jgi:hypothetical protein
MIRFSFSIVNPWARDSEQYTYFYKDFSVAKNKAGEIQISSTSPYDLFSITFNCAFRGSDHAGIELTLAVYKFFFNFMIYDTRHWDFEKGTWE